MKIFICNAFSLSMLCRKAQDGTPRGYATIAGDNMEEARLPRPVSDPIEFLNGWMQHSSTEVESAVGHADTAALFSSILDMEIPANRVSVKLEKGNLALIGQYVGPRLPEGTTTLPEGASVEWWVV